MPHRLSVDAPQLSDPTPAPRAADPEAYAVHATRRQEPVHDCFVELHHDGSVVLVVDGERLFRMESFDDLLVHYQLERGVRREDGLETSERETRDAHHGLRAAELEVMVEIARVAVRPRADKAIVDPRVHAAIGRVVEARTRLDATRTA